MNVLDAAGVLGPAKAGDITYCPQCGAVCTLTDELALRLLSGEEYYLQLSPEIRAGFREMGIEAIIVFRIPGRSQRLVDG